MNRKMVIGCSVVFVLIFGYVTQCNVFQSAGLDEAMQRYLTVVADGDMEGFGDLLAINHNFRFSSYRGSTGNLMASESYTRGQALTNLSERGGLYYALFGGDSHYRYRDRISAAPLSSWKRTLSGYRWQDGNLKSYVKWSSEGGEWKVIEVSDMVP